MADLEAKVRQLEIQLKEKEVALSQVQCKLIQTKQQLCTAEQQIVTHKDYKLKLEQVLSNMQVQHELIVAKLTLANQPVDNELLSQNKRRLELQEVFEIDTRSDTWVQCLSVDNQKVVPQEMRQDVQVTTEPEVLQYPIQCQGDMGNQVKTYSTHICLSLLNYMFRT